MNWRIQNQILVPIMLFLAVGISLSTYFNIQGLVENENQRVEVQIEDLFETLSSKSFPLQPSVLVQVEQLTGIHLLVSENGELSSSYNKLTAEALESKLKQAFGDGRSATASLDREYSVFVRKVPERKAQIFALYPRDQFFAAVRKVIYPEVVSGVLTLLVVSIIVILIARKVTRPVQSLRKHVSRIADGDFTEHQLESDQIAKSAGNEIVQLFDSVNEMASKLRIYEKRIRAQEKLLTLDQMGGGIAHQMRNSITGCRLALDLHQQDCQGDQESLDVAIRQLTFMEDFQKRFLSFTRDNNRAREKMDLVAVVHQYTKLLEPFARHVNVKFEVKVPDEPQWIKGNENMIQQLVGNLVTNAIEAASTSQSGNEKSVSVEILNANEHPTLKIRDSGDGIPDRVSDQLFEPLVTTKPDGVGLGLAIVKQTADEHDAEIQVSRVGGFTDFTITFPSESMSQSKTTKAE